jgi:hypothetical protein
VPGASISAGMKKLMKGVPLARAPLAANSRPGRTSGSAHSSGSRNVMASVEPGASAATWRSMDVIASCERYMLTPLEATTAGLPASKPATANRCHHVSSAWKSAGTSRSQSGTPKPSSTRRCRFQAWEPGWSTSNTFRREAISGRRWAKVSRPAPRMTY